MGMITGEYPGDDDEDLNPPVKRAVREDKTPKLKACPHLRGFFNTCIGDRCQIWDDERNPPDCGFKQLHPGQERHVIEVVQEPEIMPGTKKIYTTKGSRTKKA